MQQLNNDMFPIEKSSYFHIWELEKKEVEKLKWFESERIGKDCGSEYAVWVWTMRHRQKWLSGMRQSGMY